MTRNWIVPLLVSALTIVCIPRAVSAQGIDPVAAVDPFIGTGVTPGAGAIGDFPGASAPFGMLQWSPETISKPPSGGYAYADHAMSGLSLNHLAGTACYAFGDFAFLPTTGPVADPAHAFQPFTHASEHASPGSYSALLGVEPIQVRLAVSNRAGAGEFTFPRTRQANVLLNASSNQIGVTEASIEIVSPTEVIGSAASGSFCGAPNVYRVYFDAVFDRPMAAGGTWNGKMLHPGAPAQGGPRVGAWATFDTTSDPVVRVKVALSYVSTAGAQRNLVAQSFGWSVDALRDATAAQWRSLFDELQVQGGTRAEQRIFYTALYHALLAPTLFSDSDGAYMGFDGAIHQAAGRDMYANFSGWDTYRTQMPLVALLAPHQASDMVRSLLVDAEQGGWLPKWPAANGYTGVMNGDSAAPLIAGAYAFGARDFDLRAALRALRKNASDATAPPGQGWFRPRPGLVEYLNRGYVPDEQPPAISPIRNGGSATLEYALDDFSVAQIARAAGDEATARTFMKRAQTWMNVFDTALHRVQPRDAQGAFLSTPSQSQRGFQEGNSAQYTWMVPHDLRALVNAMGGQTRARAQLDSFFGELNAGPDRSFAWLGNEPGLGTPWTYVYAGAPYRAQAIVRRALRTLYDDTPGGLPGDDDLGTLSAWYVWNAIGLYPSDPAIAQVLVGSPLFTRVILRTPSGLHLSIDADGASDDTAYVDSLRIDGAASQRAWMQLPLSGERTVRVAVSAVANPRWGASPPAETPSHPLRFAPSTRAAIALRGAGVPGNPALDLILSNPGPDETTVDWRSRVVAGLRVLPARGLVRIRAGSVEHVPLQVHADAGLHAALYDVEIDARTENGAVLARAHAPLRVGAPPAGSLLYVVTSADHSVSAIDTRTGIASAALLAGGDPSAVIVDERVKRLFVTDAQGDEVRVIDAASGREISRIAVPNGPAAIVQTPGRLWIAPTRGNAIEAIDTVSLRVVASVAVGAAPAHLARSPAGDSVYVVNGGSDSVSVIDTATATVSRTIAVGERPAGIAVSPDGRTLYVASELENRVAAFDAITGAQRSSFAVGHSPRALVLSVDGATLFCVNAASASVSVIDTARAAPARTVYVGTSPYDAVMSPDGHAVYVAVAGNNQVVQLDARTGNVQRVFHAGAFPSALSI